MNPFKAVIGIGASAGGLEALQQFIQGIGDIRGYSYIICQHLSPVHRSHLVDLLSKDSVLPVKEARHGQVLKSDEILICPPNRNITVDDERVILSSDDSHNYLTKPSVDLFLESIAKVYQARSVGVILSGTGSDGARGIRAIKSEGGVSIVQQPDTAKYDGMPNSAILSGHVDLVMPASVIIKEVEGIFRLGVERPGFLDDSEKTRNILQKIILLLKESRKVDFTLYKLNTIKRRVERRMAAKKFASLAQYHKFLSSDHLEIDALFDDILIHVTEFFREPESFKLLSEFVGNYLESLEHKQLRVWVAGCSTGEEAYTVAIILLELLGKHASEYSIQIFATDIDDASIQIARSGRYSQAALANVPSKLVQKYFDVVDGDYRVRTMIRELCVFSVQDIIKDPPFIRMDLVTCRNTLIYFKPELQAELLEKFQYVLKLDGILMLGRSESLGTHVRSDFKVLDKSHKLFSVNNVKHRKYPRKPVEQQYNYTDPKIKPRVKDEMQELILSRLDQHILPNCVMVNENMDLVYSKGQNPYIISQQGIRNDNIYHNIHPELSVELRHSLMEVKKTGKLVKTVLKGINIFGFKRHVRMIVLPVTQNNNLLHLIYFQEEDQSFLDAVIATEGNAPTDQQLKSELDRTRVHMNAMVHELETNNEEMQNLNEELQSSNEELQSTNEELETTNEELQSTNEELHSAYTELQIAYEAKNKESREHLQTREKLEINSERLELVLKASRLGFCQVHIPPYEHDIWSERFARILDFQQDQLPQDKRTMLDWFRDHIVSEFQQDYKVAFDQFLEGDLLEFEQTFKVRTSKAQERWVRQLARAIKRDPDGKVLSFIATFQDMTDDYELSEQIRVLNERLAREVQDQEVLISEQEARLGQIVQALRLGIWEWVEEEQKLTVSPALISELAIETAPKSLDGLLNYLQTDENQNLKKQMNALLDGKQLFIRQRIHYRQSDSLTKSYVLYAAVIQEPDVSRRISGFILDVTQESLRENMLEQLVEQNNLIQTLGNIGFYELDLQTSNIWRSRVYCELLNLDPNKETVTTLWSYLKHLHPDDRDAYQSFITGDNKGVADEITYRFIDAQGNVIQLSERVSRQNELLFGTIMLDKD